MKAHSVHLDLFSVEQKTFVEVINNLPDAHWGGDLVHSLPGRCTRLLCEHRDHRVHMGCLHRPQGRFEYPQGLSQGLFPKGNNRSWGFNRGNLPARCVLKHGTQHELFVLVCPVFDPGPNLQQGRICSGAQRGNLYPPMTYLQRVGDGKPYMAVNPRAAVPS